MSAVLRMLRSPGAMSETTGKAPTQYPHAGGVKQPSEKQPFVEGSQAESDSSSAVTGSKYEVKKKPGVLDRWLDMIVRASGSIPAFLIIQTLLFTWAFCGIPFNQQDLWPILISDVQAIFSYVFDSFLMRQQLNGYYESLDVAAELQSRSASVARMLATAHSWLDAADDVDFGHVLAQTEARELVEISLPPETRFGRIITFASIVLGHIGFVAFYWAAIFVWIGFGPSNGWSNQWQLDINSATSALMVFIFSFLAILRERHGDYIRSCLDAIYAVDSKLERRLRELTGDELPNDDAVIPAAHVNAVQRAINYYADIVGTLVGIAILVTVFVVWLAVGPVFQFNANWWLFIGTYAGLIGMNDGFVLRNVQSKLRAHDEAQHVVVATADAAVFHHLGLTLPPAPTSAARGSLSRRVSEVMNAVCGHEITVILGVLLILGLLIGSSVMRWSETGQLLCNVPPSIIESFFMIILITGHNAADDQRRIDMLTLLARRRVLLAWTDAVAEWRVRNPGKKSVARIHEKPNDDLCKVEAAADEEQAGKEAKTLEDE